MSTQTRPQPHPSGLCSCRFARAPDPGWATCKQCFFRPAPWSDTTREDVWWKLARQRWGLTDIPSTKATP